MKPFRSSPQVHLKFSGYFSKSTVNKSTINTEEMDTGTHYYGYTGALY